VTLTQMDLLEKAITMMERMRSYVRKAGRRSVPTVPISSSPPRVRKSVLIYDPLSLPTAAAKWVVRAVDSAIHERGRCTMILAGGTSWLPVYRRMVVPWLAERIAWDRVEIFFGDERCVPPDDRLSNYGMVRSALLSHRPIRNAAIHRIHAEKADHDAVAQAYARVLPEAPDVLLLGMGADGHTASIFPHSPTLDERERRVVSVAAASGVGRITITPPVISAAATVFVLAAGVRKANATASALEGPWRPQQVPIQLALGGTWLIDTGAARRLRGAYLRGG